MPHTIDNTSISYSTVEKAFTAPSSGDPFGRVNDGYLKIRSAAAAYTTIDFGAATQAPRFQIGGWLIPHGIICPDTAAQSLDGEALLILPILSSSDPEEMRIYGIVLQAHPRFERAFTRVAQFRVWSSGVLSFLSACKAVRSSDQTHYYGEATGKVEKDGHKEYMMTIY